MAGRTEASLRPIGKEINNNSKFVTFESLAWIFTLCSTLFFEFRYSKFNIMYKQRLQIFISFCILAVVVCIGRLAYLQLAQGDDYRSRIEQKRVLGPMQLPTIRGSIFDRNGNIIAVDEPAFYLYINYELTKLLDDQFWQGGILKRANQGQTAQQAELELRKEFEDDLAELWEIVDKCAKICGEQRAEIESKIRRTNDRIWEMRRFFAWMDEFPNSKLKAKYRLNQLAVPVNEAMRDFERQCPDRNDRLMLTMDVDLSIMHKAHKLIELKTDAQLLEAQLEFVDTEMVEILPEVKRVYPYDSAACQAIGWVGLVRQKDKGLFADDRYRRYLDDELLGKDGIEKIYEPVLRGKRGEVIYDIDSELIARTETQFGKDVALSLDIELQEEIETHLSEPNFNPNYNSAIGAVVIDVATGDILSLVSMPVYDLNMMRRNYNEVRDAPGAPLVNKAIYEIYPPGSVIKPFILTMALEEGKIEPTDIISCPHKEAPYGWPNCMQFKRFNSCHDWKWTDEGGNIAPNAIRGSCNIYFSHLADRLESSVLQRWLFKFGYGRKILPGPVFDENLSVTDETRATSRNLQHSAGQISSKIPRKTPGALDEFPKIDNYEKRMFGIGQANLRATVLHVANATAAIARGGIFKRPRLFFSESDIFNEQRQEDLGIAQSTLEVVRDGMSAVVNEWGGTAYSVFDLSELKQMDVKVYGKTGSTTAAVNAWFTGFVEDSAGRALSIAIVVEGGESGAEDAAPLARDIFTLCNEAGYIGKKLTVDDSSFNLVKSTVDE
jgi:penicillin-binding protein 2